MAIFISFSTQEGFAFGCNEGRIETFYGICSNTLFTYITIPDLGNFAGEVFEIQVPRQLHISLVGTRHASLECKSHYFHWEVSILIWK